MRCWKKIERLGEKSRKKKIEEVGRSHGAGLGERVMNIRH